MAWDTWRVDVGGDAAGGWIVDIHDGVYHAVYSPAAADKDEAGAMAQAAHSERFWPKAPEAAPDAT